MTTGDFTAEDWVKQLALALTELATTQGRYRDDLDPDRQRDVAGAGFWLVGGGWCGPSRPGEERAVLGEWEEE